MSFVFFLMFGLPLFSQQPDSLDIKIGQMIMIGINNRTAVADTDALLKEIKQQKLGGVLLFEKNIAPEHSEKELKKLIHHLQKGAPIPLFVSIDEEGGLVHRLKPKYGFVEMPSAAHLGTLGNPDSTLFYNRRLAKELHELGFNYNYAPTLDMAVNPENTVIVKRERSFSNDPAIVSQQAQLCIQAHHENKVRTILKHFPGHGSSTADSHLGIVDVSETWSFRELLPYYNVLASGSVDAVMTAHLINKRWDPSMLPATLSERTVTGILRGLLGFNGVVFSDDMQMYAISKNYGFENAIEMAVNAGVDVLMFGNNVSKETKAVSASDVHTVIKNLVLSGKIARERIDESYRRVLRLKAKSF